MKNLIIFETNSSKQKGLSDRKSIPRDTLYLFPNSNIVTMVHTNIFLKIIFVDQNFKILSVKIGVPKSKVNIVDERASHFFECSILFNIPGNFNKIISNNKSKLLSLNE